MENTALASKLGASLEQLQSALNLDLAQIRAEYRISGKSESRVSAHLKTHLQPEQCRMLLSTFSIPAACSDIFQALLLGVPSERQIVRVDLQGTIGLLFKSNLPPTGIRPMAEALGCDSNSPALDYFSNLNRFPCGFEITASRNGNLSLCIYDCIGSSQDDLMRAIDRLGPGEMAQSWNQVVPLLETSVSSEPAVTIIVEIHDDNKVSVIFEVPEVPIDHIHGILKLDCAEQAAFQGARKIAVKSGHKVFSSVSIHCLGKNTRDICFNVEVRDSLIPHKAKPKHSGDTLAHQLSRNRLSLFDTKDLPITKLFLPVGIGTSKIPRILISEGTTESPILESNPPYYRREALVPQGPWRAPNAMEQRLLLYDSPPGSPDLCVAILPIDVTQITKFNRFDLQNVTTIGQVEEIRKHPQLATVFIELAEYLADKFSMVSDQFTCLGLSAYPGGLRTVSYDHDIKRRVGLHLDTWDNVDLDARASSRNILLINLGRSDRYFLFVNVGMNTMQALLTDLPPDADGLADEFMRRFPEYPVIKIRVAPGEAYIAPVQNIIHDGSTEGSQQLDIHVAYLGRFHVSHLTS